MRVSLVWDLYGVCMGADLGLESNMMVRTELDMLGLVWAEQI